VTIFGQGGPNGASLIMGGLGSFSEPSFSVYNLGGTATTSLLSTYGIFATNTGSTARWAMRPSRRCPSPPALEAPPSTLTAARCMPWATTPPSERGFQCGHGGNIDHNVAGRGANIGTNGFSIGIQTKPQTTAARGWTAA